MINEQSFYYFQSGDTLVSQTDSLLKADSINTIVKSDSISSEDSVTIKDSIQPIKETDSIILTNIKDTTTQGSIKIISSDTTANRIPAGNKEGKQIRTNDTVSVANTFKEATIKKTKDSTSVIATADTTIEDSASIFLNGTISLPAPIKRKSTSPIQEYNDWLSVFLIFSMIIIGFLRISSMKFLRELFNSAFYSQAASRMYSSINIRNSKPSFVLSGLFFLNTGVFIFEALVFYHETIFNQTGFSLLLIIWGVLIGYDVIKGFLYRMVGFVFDTSILTGEYVFNATMLSKVYAIFLLPIISVIPFVNIWIVPNLIKIGIGVFIILYIWQLFRGIKMFFQNTFSGFYMFLYFCALEILPMVILYKILFS